MSKINVFSLISLLILTLAVNISNSKILQGDGKCSVHSSRSKNKKKIHNSSIVTECFVNEKCDWEPSFQCIADCKRFNLKPYCKEHYCDCDGVLSDLCEYNGPKHEYRPSSDCITRCRKYNQEPICNVSACNCMMQ